jgi:hypothetical protein
VVQEAIVELALSTLQINIAQILLGLILMRGILRCVLAGRLAWPAAWKVVLLFHLDAVLFYSSTPSRWGVLSCSRCMPVQNLLDVFQLPGLFAFLCWCVPSLGRSCQLSVVLGLWARKIV